MPRNGVTTLQRPYLLNPVNTFAELRDLTVRDQPNTLVFTASRSYLGDGFCGLFQFQPDAFLDDDDATIIKPNSVDAGEPGRWINIFTGGNIDGGEGGSGSLLGDVTGNLLNNFISYLQGRPVNAASPNPGDYLYYDADADQWIPRQQDTTLNGDVTGDMVDNEVSFLQGNPLLVPLPNNNEFLMFNGEAWIPSTVILELDGDVTGDSDNNQISAIQGNPVDAETPNPEDYMKWDGYNWIPSPISSGLPTPDNYGNILYAASDSSDPLVYTNELPLCDDNGFVLTDNYFRLVVSG